MCLRIVCGCSVRWSRLTDLTFCWQLVANLQVAIPSCSGYVANGPNYNDRIGAVVFTPILFGITIE